MSGPRRRELRVNIVHQQARRQARDGADFRGNRYFNTLGNLLGEPRSSLLFPDFETGDLLQLQGLATIDWSPAAAARFEGAERIWHFRFVRGWFRPRAAMLRGAFIDYSPVTLRTGTWTTSG